MKRCGVCLGILAGLILLCVSSLLVVRAECRQYMGLTERVAEAIASGDTKAALDEFDVLDDKWDDFHDICGLFVNGAKLDPIRDALAELRPLIAQEHPEAAAELEKLRRYIEGVYEEEIPAFWHIL